MKRFLLLLMLLATACGQKAQQPAPDLVSANQISTMIAMTSQALANSTPTATQTATSTLTSYEPYTINSLRKRTYGGGKIEVLQVLAETDSLTRYLIRYPSDGLNIYGFANVPKSAGPHSIIIAVHGYLNLDTYAAQNYDVDILDLMTQRGYIILFPNLRNYLPSDNGDNVFLVGMSIDVLNLIALAKSSAGPAELFSRASPAQIGLWGYSMGGGIVLRVLTISPDIKAAVLYASISGDAQKDVELLNKNSSYPLSQLETTAPPEALKRISPNNYYRYITAPIQLFHGTADSVIPLAWAQDTCSALTEAGVNINCMYFPGEDHSFRSRVSDQFYGAMFAFYQKYLSP